MMRPLQPGLAAEEAFLAGASRPYPFFLDSGGGAPQLRRRSYVGSDPFLVVHAKGERARLSWPRTGAQELWHGSPPGASWEGAGLRARVLPEGAVGYRAYDVFPFVGEGFFPWGDLAESDEAFLTNSVVEVAPLVRLDGFPLGPGRPGPATRRFQVAYRARVAAELGG